MEYQELRGVMIKSTAIIHREFEVVAELGVEILTRYSGGHELPDDAIAGIRAQAGKRVALQFVPQSTASWDHAKLGGAY